MGLLPQNQYESPLFSPMLDGHPVKWVSIISQGGTIGGIYKPHTTNKRDNDMNKLIYSLVPKTGGGSIPCKSLRHAKGLLRIAPKNRLFIKGEYV